MCFVVLLAACSTKHQQFVHFTPHFPPFPLNFPIRRIVFPLSPSSRKFVSGGHPPPAEVPSGGVALALLWVQPRPTGVWVLRGQIPGLAGCPPPPPPNTPTSPMTPSRTCVVSGDEEPNAYPVNRVLYWIRTAKTTVQKKDQKCGNTGSPCLDKPVLAQGGGGVQGCP